MFVNWQLQKAKHFISFDKAHLISSFAELRPILVVA